MLGGASNPRSQSLLPHNTVDINKPVDATPTAAGSGLYSDHNPQHDVDDDEWRLKASDFPRADWPGPVEAGCLNVLGRRRTRVDKYYHQQREILREFNELDVLIERQGLGPGMVGDGAVEEEDDDADAEGQAHDNGRKWWCGGGVEREEALAIRVSNYANMVLFAAKVLVSVKSGSLAIIASTLDSLLDLLSGFILWFTAHTMKRPNPYHYPIGKNRMQPVGILVFASVMATLGLQILIESGRRLVSKAGSLDLAGSKAAWVIGVMVSVTVVKFFLMLLCQAYKNGIVRAYAKDHFFDVVTNSVGLAAAFLAYKFQWWIDPAGAVVLAIYTIWNWSFTVLENVKSLVGETAPPDFLQKLTYLCWNHHPDVKQIDTVRAYTFGGFYFVEVDIVLQDEMPLRAAHDIGESLQNKLERLPQVERAFVHLDYEVSHRPEHAP